MLLMCSLQATASAQVKLSPANNKPIQQKDNNPKPKNSTSDKNEGKKQKTVTAKRAKALMKFVKKHHPEILPLMEVLKKNRPHRYRRVVNGLDREVLSLERIKQRSADDYQIALEQWINRSQVRLLSAQVSTADSVAQVEKIREQIRRLLKQNQELRIKKLQQDLEETQARTRRIAQSLDELRNHGDEVIEKKIQSTTKLPRKLRASSKKSLRTAPRVGDSSVKLEDGDEKQ